MLIGWIDKRQKQKTKAKVHCERRALENIIIIL